MGLRCSWSQYTQPSDQFSPPHPSFLPPHRLLYSLELRFNERHQSLMPITLHLYIFPYSHSADCRYSYPIFSFFPREFLACFLCNFLPSLLSASPPPKPLFCFPRPFSSFINSERLKGNQGPLVNSVVKKKNRNKRHFSHTGIQTWAVMMSEFYTLWPRPTKFVMTLSQC